jgi:1,4-alpha-glucan branching enzyme
MGGELGQASEWDHDASVDWHLREDASNAGILRWVRDLNALHRAEAALHALDAEPRGFEWLDASDAEGGTLCFLRRGPSERDLVVVALNLTPMPHERFRIGLPVGGVWHVALNSDAQVYGGSGMGNLGRVEAEPTPWHDRPHSAQIVLPPLAGVFLRPGAA